MATRHGPNQENAEERVWEELNELGQSTEMISDTGTVENLQALGYTINGIAEGMFTNKDLLDSISWLD